MFNFRKGTMDQIIYDQVLYYNEYQLPDQFSKSDLILDIGAHIGAFTYAVLQRGAGKVYAIEADAENHRLASRNLANFIQSEQAVLLYGAAWRSDPNDDVLYHDGYSEPGWYINTGGGGVL